MSTQGLYCPHCQGTEVVRHGKTHQGKPRYRAKRWAGHPFLRAYAAASHAPVVTHQRVERAIPARGMRDTVRVVPVRPPTVLAA